MRVIKKYAARKMYDVEDSRFITLLKIADLIDAGEEIRVVDDKTGEDITPTVLTQIILEQQRGGRDLSSVPGLFCELIKNGTSSVLGFLEKPVFGPEEKAAEDSKGMLESFIKKTIARMNIPTRTELKKLEREIRELNGRLMQALKFKNPAPLIETGQEVD